ncbi:sphingomyelinase C-like [Anneissia japonica]|uniref:sphingomyelinase C-like n=1 Tax=Anneissia japonica TaxID=1529436 RepID=UPI0014256094|nr:sphingomyelinase C-like [Anneissia japonica]
MILRAAILIHLFHLVASKSYSEYWSCAGGEENLLQLEKRPYVWIDASSARHPPSRLTCWPFGLDFICTNSSGGTNSTDVVLCAAPIARPLGQPTGVNSFQVVSYNIYELDYIYNPAFLGLPPVFSYSGQRERTCRIPLNIIRGHRYVDVIVFQEVYMGGCFPNEMDLRDLLTYYGFRYITPNVGAAEEANPLLLENGGVAIASRWPIVYYEQYIFNISDPTTADAFAAKGVMYAHIMKSDDKETLPYHVFGTHMQAEVGATREVVREAQATQMSKFIAGLEISTSEPVIMAGDFNADMNNFPDHAERVLDNMGAILPNIAGPLRTTWDPLTNELILDKEQPTEQWLDYVVLSSSHLTEGVRASVIAFKPRCPTFSVCIAASTGEYVSSLSPDCEQTLDVVNLSDHYAVIGSFLFPRNSEKKKKCCKNRRFQ